MAVRAGCETGSSARNPWPALRLRYSDVPYCGLLARSTDRGEYENIHQPSTSEPASQAPLFDGLDQRVTMRPIPATGDQIGQYRVVGERGRGGMAVVLEVEHIESGDRRAAKLLLPGKGNEPLARRLLREHRALSRLDHENVVKVYEVGVHQGSPYFVMELLQGQEVGAVVQDWQQLPPSERFRRARKVLIAVARALEHIHERGLVHRDVTPSNVMLLPGGRVKLMDFGVVKEPGDDLTTVGEVIGTIAYIAPEQIQGGLIDARADLYSMGAVFYLMLTGRRPFNARTTAGYMNKHLHGEVRPPRALVPTIPELADQVCTRLLAKRPTDRFSSATHLLHVLHASVPPGPSPGQVGWSPTLVGRAAEMAHIRTVLHPLFRLAEGEAVDAPTGCVLVIEGADGLGRNRLAAEVDLLARRHGLSVTRSRALGDDQRAFEAFRPLYEDELANGAAEYPALLATFGDARIQAGKRVERYAVMKAFAQLLANGPPRLLVLHELQRAQQGSIELAEYLIRNLVSTGNHPITFVITRRASETDDDTNDPLLGILTGERTGGRAAERVVLEPMSAAAVEELLLTVVADSPLVRPLAARIHQDGAGSPFIIAEMIRALVETGHITNPQARGTRGRLTMSLEQVRRGSLPVPRSLRDALKERLAPLSPNSQRVAATLAVSQDSLGFELLQSACDLSESELMVCINDLLRARLAHERSIDGNARISLVRNRIRDVILGQTTPDLYRLINRKLGEALELRYQRNSEVIVESLARHFEEGGFPAKAMPYMVQAAKKLITRTFVSEGLLLLDRALTIEPEARRFFTLDDADRRRAELQLERARALSHLGDWPAAREAVRCADDLAQDLNDLHLQTRTATELAAQARRHLQYDHALDHLRRALQLAEILGNRRLQIEPLYEFGAIQWSRANLDAAQEYFNRALASSEAYQDERALALGTNGLGLISMCKGQSTEARRYFEQSMAVCEKNGMMDRLTVARINLIEVYHLTGKLRKGLDLADRTVAHAREVAHRYGIALGLRYRSLILTDIGRLVDSVENAEEALRICREVGSAEDILSVIIVLIRARLVVGQGTEVLPLLQEALEMVHIADAEGFQPILHVWRARFLAHSGQLEDAHSAIEDALAAPSRQWPQQKCRLQLNLARAYEAIGETDSALDAAEIGLRIADACGFRYYAMRARHVLARLQTDKTTRARHARVASALARSLAVGLARDDLQCFLEHQGVKRRRTLRLGLDRTESTP